MTDVPDRRSTFRPSTFRPRRVAPAALAAAGSHWLAAVRRPGQVPPPPTTAPSSAPTWPPAAGSSGGPTPGTARLERPDPSLAQWPAVVDSRSVTSVDYGRMATGWGTPEEAVEHSPAGDIPDGVLTPAPAASGSAGRRRPCPGLGRRP